MDNLPVANDNSVVVGFGAESRLSRRITLFNYFEMLTSSSWCFFEDFNLLSDSDIENVNGLYGETNVIWRVIMCDTEKIVYENKFSRLRATNKKYVLEYQDSLNLGLLVNVDNVQPLSRCECGLFKIQIDIKTVNNSIVYARPEGTELVNRPILLITEKIKVTKKMVPFQLKHISAAMVLKNLSSYSNEDIFNLQNILPVTGALTNLMFRYNECQLSGLRRRVSTWNRFLMSYARYNYDYQIHPFCACIQHEHETNLCRNDTIHYMIFNILGEINGHLQDCPSLVQ